MTSNERLRRRQYRLGIFVLILAIFSTAQAVYFTIQDQKQTDCVERNFSEFNRVSQLRSELVERESEAEKGWQLVFAESAEQLKDNPTGEIDPKEADRLQTELVHKLLVYKEEIDKIDQLRKDNPVPDYSTGLCDDGENVG